MQESNKWDGLSVPVRYEVEIVVPQRARRVRKKVVFGADQYLEARELAREYVTKVSCIYEDGKRRDRCPWTGLTAKRGWRAEHTANANIRAARERLEAKLIADTPSPKRSRKSTAKSVD